MATITLSLTGSVDGKDQTVTKSATIDDASLPYFFQCYRQKFGTSDPAGVIPLTTDEEAFSAFALDLMNQGVAETKSFVRQQVVSQIKIPDITVIQNG